MKPKLNKMTFVFGTGRSGTTLLAKVIDSSRSVLYKHEPDRFLPNNSLPYLPENYDYPKYSNECKRYLDALTAVSTPVVSGKPPIFNKNFRSNLSTAFIRNIHPVLSFFEKINNHVPFPGLINTDNVSVVIKSVSSTCRVPMFSASSPGTKFIHVVRHPGAVMSSLLRGIDEGKMDKEDFSSAVSKMSNSKNYPFTYDDIEKWSFAEKFTYVWMVQNDKTYVEMKDSKNYMLVHYEDFCLNMKNKTKDICKFIDIEYDEQMDEFVNSFLTIDTDSNYFSVMKNPLSNIRKWENKVDAELRSDISKIIEKSELGRLVLENYLSVRDKL